MMNLTIAARLYLGVTAMLALIALGAAFIWSSTYTARDNYQLLNRSTAGAVELASAQSALWQLRYGFPQFMVSDDAARARIVADDEKWYKDIDGALSAYGATQLSDQETQALSALRDIYKKYIEARPAWFELYGAGKVEEAKALRARTTTPYGAATVRAFNDLIALQQKVGTERQRAVEKSADLTRRGILVFALIALIAGATVAYMVGRSIVEPIRQVLAATEDLRAGDGDLTKRLPAFGAEFGTLAASLNGFVGKLHEVMGNVRSSAESVKAASVQISEGSLDLSQRAQEQAATLEETAASMEQLTVTVKQNADNAKKANRLAQDASDVALAGGAVVAQVVTTMDGIVGSSKRIADITAVIDSIAFQTNILALNAAVEAARAGDQGRGFAVVASEVRLLAQRSAEAAKEIRDLIANSTGKVQEGTKLVEQAGSTMKQIVDAVKSVTATVAEISSASQEQSQGIDQVKTAVDQLEKVVQQNASFIEQTANTAASMDGQAEQLLRTVRGFKLSEAAALKPPAQEAPRRAAAPAASPRRGMLPVPGELSLAGAQANEEWKQF